ncbi:serine/arginine repetitive matrix protein 1-like [Senna tora]|uniref:Serine/arginine repetitive matrix protein 1-like n=1 Tax=Senna tora TaxID=362788 RepID=A0A835CM12_9FABA|nr:serine/arginine repetitive matrix protein 1-like [Senna tora]
MANQPPARPWFRLASLRPVSAAPAPAPAPAPEPRSSLVQPTIRTNPAPSPPQAQQIPPPPPVPAAAPTPPPAAAPTPQPAIPDRGSGSSSPVQKSPVQSYSSMPTSPHLKASVTTFSTDSSSSSPAKGVTTARGSSPSTKPVVQTPSQSPKVKPITPPPSPLTLPPSQLKANSVIEPKIPVEAESKNVIVQKTIEKPKQWISGNSGEILKTHNEKQKGNQRRVSDSEESGMKIITIAGENRGAYMELIQHQKKHEFEEKPNYLYKIGNSKTKSSGESESSSSDEANANKKENRINRGRTKSSYPMSAFMNSNVQCVNNSLLYNTSCTHNDPGVRLSLSKKPFGVEGFHLKEIANWKHD